MTMIEKIEAELHLETEQPAEIEVELETPVGPRVRWYGDEDEEEIEAALPGEWAVDWQTGSVRTDSGGWSAPLCRACASCALSDQQTPAIEVRECDQKNPPYQLGLGTSGVFLCAECAAEHDAYDQHSDELNGRR